MRRSMISRKDMDMLYEKHVLHSRPSLLHLNYRSVHRSVSENRRRIPRTPLAIFSEVKFHLGVIAIGKKIKWYRPLLMRS